MRVCLCLCLCLSVCVCVCVCILELGPRRVLNQMGAVQVVVSRQLFTLNDKPVSRFIPLITFDFLVSVFCLNKEWFLWKNGCYADYLQSV